MASRLRTAAAKENAPPVSAPAAKGAVAKAPLASARPATADAKAAATAVAASAKPTSVALRLASTARVGAAAAAAPPLPPASSAAGGAASAAAKSGAASMSIISAAIGAKTVLDAFGIGRVTDHLEEAFEGDMDASYGSRYGKIIAKPMPKKTPSVDLRAHDNLVKAHMENLQRALADAVSRRDRAMAAAAAFETAAAEKLAETVSLREAVEKTQADKAATDAQIAELQAALKASEAGRLQAKVNEDEANAEIDEANITIQQLEDAKAELEAQIARMQEEIADQEVINRGLEDDKEELKERIQALETTVAEADSKHAAEVARIRSTLTEASSTAQERAAGLGSQLSRVTEELKAAKARVTELERSVALTDIDIAKLRADRDAAVEAKTTLAAEYDRAMKQQQANQASMSAAMESLSRTQAMAHGREADLRTEITTLQAKVTALTDEHHAQKLTETTLRVDLQNAASREAKLTADLTAATTAAASLREQLAVQAADLHRLTGELAVTKASLDSVTATLASTKEDLEGKLSLAHGTLMDTERKLVTASEANAGWEAKSKEWAVAKEELTTGKSAAEDAIATLSKELETLRESAGATTETQLDKLCQMTKEREELKRRVRDMATLKQRLAQAEATIAQLNEDVFTGEIARRALHNQVQELKGNIRVYVRVRPFLPGDAVSEEDADDSMGAGAPGAAIACAPDGTSLTIIPPAPRGTKEGPARRVEKPLGFAFDTVFGPRTTQEDVFNEVQHLVQSALDGYNVCLFSYGQTGSGKTHTMQGGSGDHAGLIPRSVKQILETSGKMSGQGWRYSLEVSFLEIYNENIRDLLRLPKAGSSGNAAGAASSSAAAAEPASLAIHQDVEGHTDVPGLTRVAVSDASEIDTLLVRAAKRRAVASTAMNEQSSRSHQVFTLYIKGAHAGKGIAVTGSLNLCDLAGSERLSRSGAEGDRKKEAAAINKSLSCLADVFTALAKKTSHVPFRNSKLTHLLQPCFRGDGKTLMMVNLSPTMASAHESLCSLRFAAQVSQVELGKPRKRVVEALADDAPASSSSAAAAGSHYGASAATGGAGTSAAYDDEDVDDVDDTPALAKSTSSFRSRASRYMDDHDDDHDDEGEDAAGDGDAGNASGHDGDLSMDDLAAGPPPLKPYAAASAARGGGSGTAAAAASTSSRARMDVAASATAVSGVKRAAAVLSSAVKPGKRQATEAAVTVHPMPASSAKAAAPGGVARPTASSAAASSSSSSTLKRVGTGSGTGTAARTTSSTAAVPAAKPRFGTR